MTRLINQNKNIFTVISGLLILVGLALPFVSDTDATHKKAALLIAATVIAGIPIAYSAFQALKMRVFSIELLVTIAFVGALIIKEYTESSIVTFLFLFGAYLEARNLEKTRSSLKKLMDIAPQEAIIYKEGSAQTVAIENVAAGDTVIVRIGGKIAVDGTIIKGKANINESAITGESVPAFKSKGDKVFSGTIIESGYIELTAEKVGGDTTFAKIIELVEEAQDSKSKTQKFLDKFANIYTPSIVLLSVIVYLITLNIHIAITFLVVACPGALVIGAPVSIVAGIGNGAKNGVLLKGGEVVERLAKINTVLFDKTGTLTKGKPQIIEIKTFAKVQENELLRLAAEAETVSEHHLGLAIIRAAKERGIEVSGTLSIGEVYEGKGVAADIEGQKVIVGNRKLLIENNIEINSEIEEFATSRENSGSTAVFVALDGEIAGVICIADDIKKDAKQAIYELRKNGIKKIIMLTGDNALTAEKVAAELRLDGFYAELMPKDKVDFVKKLQLEGHRVAMAGDGINDAPSIAAADIGLAMGESGTDISMETADVVLLTDKLTQFSHALALAKATVRNMKQNTIFALAVVLILLTGVLFEYIHLASGMFIHEASVLIVILNAMRLLGFKKKKQKTIPFT